LGKIVDGKLQVIGRVDDVIISGGENISLSAVESEINKKFPNLQVAAFATSDSKWGQVLHVAAQTNDESIKEQIMNLVAQSIGNYAKPKSIVLVDKLPLIGVGKVDRISLAKLVNQ
jgi:O-succinylbenzoic acid--CoA ligase